MEEYENNSEEIYTVRIDDSTRHVDIGVSSIIGRRNDQQDAVKADNGYDYLENGKVIAVLCDGMGGLSSGGAASALCSSIVFDTFHNSINDLDIPAFFKSVIYESDLQVSQIKNDDETVGRSGTTLASIIIDDNKLFWASVGDSRVYIIRNSQILKITNDHNYYRLLMERVANGELTQEEADCDPKKEALISYIGIRGVRYADLSSHGVELKHGDAIIICSDGLYRSISDDEIMGIVNEFASDAQEGAEALTSFALNKNFIHQDNTSAILVRFFDLE